MVRLPFGALALVEIANLHIVCIAAIPGEADAILPVDPDLPYLADLV